MYSVPPPTFPSTSYIHIRTWDRVNTVYTYIKGIWGLSTLANQDILSIYWLETEGLEPTIHPEIALVTSQYVKDQV